jgi:ribosome biogenesis protein Tsr3
MFALGAGLGAWATVHFGNPCVLAPVAALAAAFLLCL